MGRRAKPVELLDQQKRTKAEIATRTVIENAMRKKGIGDPPDWLDDEAKSEWNRVVSASGVSDIWTAADRSILAAYCQAVSIYRKAVEQVQREGIVVMTAKGPTQHPAITIAEKAYRMLRQSAISLGLEPAARASLAKRAAEGADVIKDELEEFLDF